ncbi:hypothetical protein [Aeromonas salmonicida]|nr:hypothetical protein [Aeromonas salmonicida]
MTIPTATKGTVDMTVPELAQRVADGYRSTCGDTFQDRGVAMPLNHAEFPASIAAFVRELHKVSADDVGGEQMAALMLQGMLTGDGSRLLPSGLGLVDALLYSIVDEIHRVMKDIADTGSPAALAMLLRIGEFKS